MVHHYFQNEQSTHGQGVSIPSIGKISWQAIEAKPRRCPSNLPYSLESGCLKKCPLDYAPFANTCIPKVLRRHYKRSNRYNRVACDICGGERPYCFHSRCYRECPTSTFIVERTSGQEFTSYKTCVSSCPADLPYVEDNTCVSACSDTRVLRNKTCQKCSEKFFIYENRCVKSCPEKSPLRLPLARGFCPHTEICTDRCSDEFPLIQGSTCVQLCPDKNYILNNTCKEGSCTTPFYSYSLTRVFKNRDCSSFFYGTNVEGQFRYCLDKCHNNTVVMGNTCLPKCPNATLLVRGQCLNTGYCPSDLPFIEYTAQGRNCTNQCRDKEYLFGSKCLPICTSYENPICSWKCPKPFLLTKGSICVRSCPHDKLKDGDQCIEPGDCDGIVMEPGNICMENENTCPVTHYSFQYGNYTRQYTHTPLIGCRPKTYLTLLLSCLIAGEGFLAILLTFIVCNCRRNLAVLCGCGRTSFSVSYGTRCPFGNACLCRMTISSHIPYQTKIQ